MLRSSLRDLETGKKSREGSQEGGKEAVAETRKQRAEASDKTRNEASNEANQKNQNLRDEAEDGGEDRNELQTEAEDSDKGVDSGEKLSDKDVNEGDNGVEVAVAEVKASSISELRDQVLQNLLDLNKLGLRLLDSIVLGEVTSLDRVGNALWDGG